MERACVVQLFVHDGMDFSYYC